MKGYTKMLLDILIKFPELSEVVTVSDVARQVHKLRELNRITELSVSAI